jgi:hypothetical protein
MLLLSLEAMLAFQFVNHKTYIRKYVKYALKILSNENRFSVRNAALVNGGVFLAGDGGDKNGGGENSGGGKNWGGGKNGGGGKKCVDINKGYSTLEEAGPRVCFSLDECGGGCIEMQNLGLKMNEKGDPVGGRPSAAGLRRGILRRALSGGDEN